MQRKSQHFHPASQWLARSRGLTASSDPASFDTIGIDTAEDVLPSDEFDRALLAETAGTQQIESGSGIEKAQQPPKLASIGYNAGLVRHHSGDFFDSPRLHTSSSSSHPISSPTNAVLHKRQNAGHRSNIARQMQAAYAPGDQNEYQERHAQFYSPSAAISLAHAPPIVQGIPLVSTSELSDNMRSIFKFSLFNAVQSKCFPSAYGGDDNLVVSAPTGSGKTAIMELAICRLLNGKQNQDFKVVYQAPTRSLCSERQRDWSSKFQSLGLKCAELTGDVEFSNLKNVQQADIIVATPEKWDSVTRKWRDNEKLMRMIRLFLVDEVHILREARGATLEAVVARMKSIGTNVRFVALSATVPNSEDIATWLGLNSTRQDKPAVREVFGNDFRPTELEKHVIGYQCTHNEFVLDGMLVKEVPHIIARYSKRKPVMIFCPTQKSAMKMADSLSKLWLASSSQSQLWNGPHNQIIVQNDDLREVVSTAVAFHHGSLDAADRAAVEKGFLDGNINIICSTSTLAVGVNLPCYLVILKGTSCYTDSGLQEYSMLDVMQMLGRAGRPQFETSACAVILTSKEKTARYEKLISGQELLESSLHENLIEHLNAEIGVGTIKDIPSARKWLTSTFLYVRVQRNPVHYKSIRASQQATSTDLLEDICERNLRQLQDVGLVADGDAYYCTDFGHAMARYYVKFETMKYLLKLPPQAKVSEILDTLIQAVEFKDLRWRSGEKGLFKKINKSNEIRFPIKVDISSPSHKASLVLQAALGAFVLDKDDKSKFELYLQQDTKTVLSHCHRLIRCIIDMQLSLQDSSSAKNALELARSIAAKVWDNTPMQLKQIDGVGDITARRLASHGITTVDMLSCTDAQQIELIMGRNPPFGNNMLSRVSQFPSLRVSIKEIDRRRGSSGNVEVKVQCEIGFLNSKVPTYFNKKFLYVCFMCETGHGRLIDFRRIGANKLLNCQEILLRVDLDRPTSRIAAHVMCDEVAGTHRYAEISLDIPSSWFYGQSKAIDFESVVCNDGAEDFPVTDEDFGDMGFQDEDFFMAETQAKPLRARIEDIDDIVGEKSVVRPTINELKRMRKAIDQIDDSTSHWHEPRQLPNGNWTCQHTCNEENKDCKHQCCKDGVKKPRKRARLTSSAVNNNETREAGAGVVFGNKHLGTSDSIQSTGSKATTQVSEFGSDVDFGDHDWMKTLELSSDSLPDAKGILKANYPKTHTKNSRGNQEVTVTEFYFDDDLEYFDFADADIDLAIEKMPQKMTQQKFRTSNTSRHEEAITRIDERSPCNKSLVPVAVRAVEHNPASSLPQDTLFDEEFDDFDFDIDLKDFNSQANIPSKAKTTQAYQISHPVTNNNATKLASTQTSNQPPASTNQSEAQPRHKTTTTPTQETHYSLLSPAQEAQIEQTKREHEADQKRKWAQLEPWMFEEFGHCVDII